MAPPQDWRERVAARLALARRALADPDVSDATVRATVRALAAALADPAAPPRVTRQTLAALLDASAWLGLT